MRKTFKRLIPLALALILLISNLGLTSFANSHDIIEEKELSLESENYSFYRQERTNVNDAGHLDHRIISVMSKNWVNGISYAQAEVTFSNGTETRTFRSAARTVYTEICASSSEGCTVYKASEGNLIVGWVVLGVPDDFKVTSAKINLTQSATVSEALTEGALLNGNNNEKSDHAYTLNGKVSAIKQNGNIYTYTIEENGSKINADLSALCGAYVGGNITVSGMLLNKSGKISVTDVKVDTADTYSSSNFMGALPDNMQLGSITLPGTHDSGATKDMIISGTAKCQTLSIADQLKAGVRYFDIRLRRVGGQLNVYHGEVDQDLTFDAVLNAFYSFLDSNPSEALVVCIMEETDPTGTNDNFDTMVKNKISEASSRWFLQSRIPALSEVRGKIVLIRRFGTSGTYGFNASSGFTDNSANFKITNGAYNFVCQDYYNNESPEKKWEAITNFFNSEMSSPKANTYYLCNTSGYKSGLFGIPNINTIKNHVNPKLIEYLKTDPNLTGIIATDFMTAEIAELIYSLNFD